MKKLAIRLIIALTLLVATAAAPAFADGPFPMCQLTGTCPH